MASKWSELNQWVTLVRGVGSWFRSPLIHAQFPLESFPLEPAIQVFSEGGAENCAPKTSNEGNYMNPKWQWLAPLLTFIGGFITGLFTNFLTKRREPGLRRRLFRQLLRRLEFKLQLLGKGEAGGPEWIKAYQESRTEIRDACANIAEDIKWCHREDFTRIWQSYCASDDPQIKPYYCDLHCFVGPLVRAGLRWSPQGERSEWLSNRVRRRESSALMGPHWLNR